MLSSRTVTTADQCLPSCLVRLNRLLSGSNSNFIGRPLPGLRGIENMPHGHPLLNGPPHLAAATPAARVADFDGAAEALAQPVRAEVDAEYRVHGHCLR